jgi:Flp pilus assembly protein TadB
VGHRGRGGHHEPPGLKEMCEKRETGKKERKKKKTKRKNKTREKKKEKRKKKKQTWDGIGVNGNQEKVQRNLAVGLLFFFFFFFFFLLISSSCSFLLVDDFLWRPISESRRPRGRGAHC